MHDIHHDCYPGPVRLVHKPLELFRSAKTGAQGEEIGDLIPERTVIRMLLESHYLDSVIAEVLDMGQHIPSELVESRNLLLLRAHADMTFVNKRMRSFARLAVFPPVRLHRVPHLSTECLCLRVLHRTGHICRQSFRPTSGPLDVQLVQCAVGKEHWRQSQLPVAVAYRMESIGLRPFPVVEFSYKIDFGGVRSPFPEHPSPV